MKNKITVMHISKRAYIARLLGQAIGNLQRDPTDFLSREAIPHYYGLLNNLSPDNTETISVVDSEKE